MLPEIEYIYLYIENKANNSPEVVELYHSVLLIYYSFVILSAIFTPFSNGFYYMNFLSVCIDYMYDFPCVVSIIWFCSQFIFQGFSQYALSCR